MKRQKKGIMFPTTLLIIIIAIIVIGSIIVVSTNNKVKLDENGNELYSEKQEDGTVVNTSNKLNEDKSYKGLKFTNIQFRQDDSITSLEAQVINESGKDIKDFTHIDLIFMDRSGKEIGSAVGLIIPLKKGETTQLSASGTFDYINAYNFKIQEHKK